MIAFLYLLDEWIDEHPNVHRVARGSTDDQVKLVIIDTLSYHFRQPNMDMSARRRVMDM
jgi:RAD51-like protein 2